MSNFQLSFSQKQWINGEWVAAKNGKMQPVFNPATEEIIGEIPFGDEMDAEHALEVASKAMKNWAAKTAWQRADVLKETAKIIRENNKELADWTVLEAGKTRAEARGEWTVAAQFYEWMGEEAKRTVGQVLPSSRANKRMQVIFQPIGVVGIVTAWNFPAYNTARVWAAALAAGCTIVCKPSEFTPFTAILMAKCLEMAGLPAGVANVIHGDAEAIGSTFLASKICRKIHFVGSTRVGKRLLDGASKTNTRLSLELGGNAPAIFMGDIDVEKWAASATSCKFRNAGQVCVAPQRFLVHESIYRQFCEKVADFARKIKVGRGSDEGSQMGPLINRRQRDHVERIVSETIRSGAKLLAGGKIPDNLPDGHFYEPTVLMDVPLDSAAFLEEIFGPVMAIRSFSTLDEAIKIANSTDYGLAAYACTNDLRTANRLAEELEFGIIGINEWAPHATEAPFGGWKQSGQGAEGGAEGIREYLEKKLIATGF